MTKPAIKMDYSVKMVENEKVLSLHCQRCGSPSVDILCDSCSSQRVVKGSAAQVSGFNRLLKKVTVSGVNVFVNGELARCGANAFHAEMIAKSLVKQYSRYNLDIMERMK